MLYRLTAAAQQDITDILGRSLTEFGEAAHDRHAALIARAIRHAAASSPTVGFTTHPEYVDGVVTWHLALSARETGSVRATSPRHILVCGRAGNVLIVGRILDHSMDPLAHLDPDSDWR